MAKLRRIKYADVMSTLAAFIALGGVSYAAIKLPHGSVTGKHIKKGAVTSSHVKNRSLARKDFKAGLLPSSLSGANGGDGSDGADGSVGPMGPAGPQGPQGIEGPPGPEGPQGTARAYGIVDPTCTGGTCTVSKSKNIVDVKRVATGNYCITVSGLSSEALPAYAAVEFTKTATPHGTAAAVASTSAPDCLHNQFLVVTKRMHTASVKADPTGTVTATLGTDQAANNVGFSVLIP